MRILLGRGLALLMLTLLILSLAACASRNGDAVESEATVETEISAEETPHVVTQPQEEIKVRYQHTDYSKVLQYTFPSQSVAKTFPSEYTARDSGIDEFYSYTKNWPVNIKLIPYNRAYQEGTNLQVSEAKERLESAAKNNVNGPISQTRLFTPFASIDDGLVKFSLSYYIEPLYDNKNLYYQCGFLITNTSREKVSLTFNHIEIDGITVTSDLNDFPKTVKIAEADDSQGVFDFMWSPSTDVVEARINQIHTVSVVGCYTKADNTTSAKEFRVDLNPYDRPQNYATAVNLPADGKGLYKIMDNSVLTAYMYGFTAVANKGFKAHLYVETKDFSRDLKPSLKTRVRLTQYANSESVEDDSVTLPTLEPNAKYQTTLYGFPIAYGDEICDLGYFAIKATLSLNDDYLNTLVANREAGQKTKDPQEIAALALADKLKHKWKPVLYALTEVVNPNAPREKYEIQSK